MMSSAAAAPIRVLIVDDNRTNLMLMEMLVAKLGICEILGFTSAAAALEGLREQSFDVGIIDYQMPEVDGIELIRRIRQDSRFTSTPIVMVTVDQDTSVKMAALEAGAVEFLEKPIEPVEFGVRIRNLMRLSEALKNLADHAAWLRGAVDKATAALRWREEEIIERLSRASGYKDRETTFHTKRMARYCSILARELGLPEEFCRDIQLAAPMHDIGKVGISDDILMKNGPLSDGERSAMSAHTNIGAEILSGSECDLLQLAAEIARTHHERWDGLGYPAALKGNSIPLSGRIAAIADVFDALTCERPYKEAWSFDRAFSYVVEQAGAQFDPACVAAFERCREAIKEVMHSFSDRGSMAA